MPESAVNMNKVNGGFILIGKVFYVFFKDGVYGKVSEKEKAGQVGKKQESDCLYMFELRKSYENTFALMLSG